jgi:LmbE family N-acetylglucosaminyl deacetylase
MAVIGDEQVNRLPAASSVLAVCAHPDDESFGLGALLPAFVARGAAVSLLCFTHGEASTLGNAGRALGELRVREMMAAVDQLGVGEVELLDHPDGALSTVPLERLAAQVRHTAGRVGADLLLVFDEGGITGHPDHSQATRAAVAGADRLPVLAWSVPAVVADLLGTELGVSFTGRGAEEIDMVVAVDRERQRRAIACHLSQCADNPVLWRRLELMGDKESLRWLRSPQVARSDPVRTVGAGPTPRRPRRGPRRRSSRGAARGGRPPGPGSAP